MADNTSRPKGSQKHTAGALDIRNIIGGLLGTYGVILVLLGIFDDYDPDKTGDVNANLWAGLAMAVVGAGFMIWARVRPIVVPDDVPTRHDGPPPGH